MNGKPSGLVEWKNRFSGKLVLVLLDRKYEPSVRGGRSLWALFLPLTYRPAMDADRELISVPNGFVTDLATIPRLVWIILPPDGPWGKAAVIHDFLYTTAGTGIWNEHNGVTRTLPYTRKEADEILREAMDNRKVDWMRRTIIWAAVRIGGGSAWLNHENEERKQKKNQLSRKSKRELAEENRHFINHGDVQ